jgi:hypothetical protein
MTTPRQKFISFIVFGVIAVLTAVMFHNTFVTALFVGCAVSPYVSSVCNWVFEKPNQHSTKNRKNI